MNNQKLDWAKESIHSVNDFPILSKETIKETPQQQQKNSNKDDYITSDISLTDSIGLLKLYHYTHCDNNSSNNIKECRGIVRDGDTIVCKTFGFTPEIPTNDETLNDILKPYYLENSKEFNTTQIKIYESEEGATIRLYHYKDRWYLSTHRKLDAYQSRWGNLNSKSFGDMFIDGLEYLIKNNSININFEKREDILDRYCELLDKNKVYTFLVRNDKNNRIVCLPPTVPTIYFTGVFDKNGILLLHENDSQISTPKELFFSKYSEIEEYVNNLNIDDKQGVILHINEESCTTSIKILNPSYFEFFNIRGGNADIKYRYLQIRNNVHDVQKLRKLYPEFEPIFQTYETKLQTVANKIYKSYVKRYIRKEYAPLPKPEYYVMKQVQQLYLTTRKKITLDIVTETVNKQDARTLNNILNLYKQ